MKQSRSWIAVWRTGDARDALMIFAIAALAGLVALHFLDVQRGHPQFDGDIYRMMAGYPRTFYVAPYSLRVLTPWLVWILPFSTRAGFALTTVIGVGGTAAVLFLYVRTFGDRAAALRAVAYFALTGWVVLLFVDPWLVDAPTMLFSILTFLLVRRGHIGWATITASVAVASHESALVMLIPLAVAHYFERDRRFDTRLIPFVSVPIILYLLIRCTPLVYGYIPPSGLIQDFEREPLLRLCSPSWGTRPRRSRSPSTGISSTQISTRSRNALTTRRTAFVALRGMFAA